MRGHSDPPFGSSIRSATLTRKKFSRSFSRCVGEIWRSVMHGLQRCSHGCRDFTDTTRRSEIEIGWRCFCAIALGVALQREMKESCCDTPSNSWERFFLVGRRICARKRLSKKMAECACGLRATQAARKLCYRTTRKLPGNMGGARGGGACTSVSKTCSTRRECRGPSLRSG